MWRLTVCFLLATFCSGTLIGHLKPLGGHRPPTVTTPELQQVPQPLEFYEKFVRPRIPVVLRGAALRSAATSRWDTGTLMSEYGDLVVRVEAKAEASEKIPVTDIGFGRSTLRHFVSIYRKKDIYVISQIPRPMEKDVAIPPCLRCGNFAKSIQDVHVFIVGPGGKTLLHRDPYSNIHCVFNGTKDWILIGDDYTEHLYQSDSSLDEFGGYSDVDVDSIDLEKYPDVQKINYSLVTVEKGDCLFMPGGYWHQVRVKGQYNTAVSIWFTRDFKSSEQDWENCEGKLQDFTPMSEVDVLWRFSGGNQSFSQGHVDIYVLRSVLLSVADERHRISLPRFCQELVDQDGEERCRHVVEKIQTVLRTDENVIHVSDVKALTIEQLKIIVDVIVPVDEANTSDYEYSVIESSDVRELLVELSADGSISEDVFSRKYIEELDGSEGVAEEIFSQLDPSHRGIVTPIDVNDNIEHALAKFINAPRHDPSTERLWLRHLRQRDEL